MKHCGLTSEKPDRDLALQRLDSFSFIGITDDWDTSVCLFHMKLGGTCHASEFLDSRPTPKQSAAAAKAAEEEADNLGKELGAVVDNDDLAVYKEALRRYEADLKKCDDRSGSAFRTRLIGPSHNHARNLKPAAVPSP